jgi:hypothetical protein
MRQCRGREVAQTLVCNQQRGTDWSVLLPVGNQIRHSPETVALQKAQKKG